MISDKRFAKHVTEVLLDCSGRLDELVADAKQRCPEGEFLAFRRAVGEVMGETWDELLGPIFNAHPDLKPKEVG